MVLADDDEGVVGAEFGGLGGYFLLYHGRLYLFEFYLMVLLSGSFHPHNSRRLSAVPLVQRGIVGVVVHQR